MKKLRITSGFKNTFGNKKKMRFHSSNENKRLTVVSSLLIALTIFFGACKHETKFDKLDEISYSASIAPIINANCSYSGCHGDVNTKSFNGLTYEGLMSSGVVNGKPDKSKLYKSLVSLNSEDMMPTPAYGPLTDKQIQLVYVWIGQGAKNN
jgi:hypothetical protein